MYIHIKSFVQLFLRIFARWRYNYLVLLAERRSNKSLLSTRAKRSSSIWLLNQLEIMSKFNDNNPSANTIDKIIPHINIHWAHFDRRLLNFNIVQIELNSIEFRWRHPYHTTPITHTHTTLCHKAHLIDINCIQYSIHPMR